MAAKQAFGLDILVENASTERDLETAFAAFAQWQVAALVVGSDPFFYSERVMLWPRSVRCRQSIMIGNM